MATKPIFGPGALKPGELSELPKTKPSSSKIGDEHQFFRMTATALNKKEQSRGTTPISTPLSEVSDASNRFDDSEIRGKAHSTKQSQPSQSATKPKHHFWQKIYQLQAPWEWGLDAVIAVVGYFMTQSEGADVSFVTSLLFPFSMILMEKFMGTLHHQPYQLFKRLWQAVRQHKAMALLVPIYGLGLLFYFMVMYIFSFGIGLVGLIYALVMGFKR